MGEDQSNCQKDLTSGLDLQIQMGQVSKFDFQTLLPVWGNEEDNFWLASQSKQLDPSTYALWL